MILMTTDENITRQRIFRIDYRKEDRNLCSLATEWKLVAGKFMTFGTKSTN